MTDKYYTPSIEEFYVGFEYEAYIPELEVWSKEIFHLNESHINLIKYVDNQNDSTLRRVRVKYLNEKDIRELGWSRDITYYKQQSNSEFLLSAVIGGIEKNHLVFYIDYFEDKHRVNTSMYNKENNYTIDPRSGTPMFVFSGTIKNKNELKTLMKWLNITT